MIDFDERTINILENIKAPNIYWNKRTWEYKYWFRALLQKIDSSLIFSGIPENWSNDFFMLCLWARGFVAVFETNRTGLQEYGPKYVFQPCNVAGFDFYFQPKTALISNPLYQAELTIGKQCEILKLTPDFMGIFDILDYYASKLAEISKGIDMGIINAKTPMILSAKNEAQAQTLKKVYDKVQRGESLVVFDDTSDNDEIIPVKDPFEAWNNDFTKTYIVHSLLEDMQSILDSFYVEIGLPVAIEKKERIITSEADFASAQSQARIACWVETLRESFDRIKKIYPDLNLGVEYARENNISRNGTGTEQPEQINNRRMDFNK